MDRIIIENVRCFRGRHEVPLAPVTILVGENSTGKSTCLAAARLAWDLGSNGQPAFNEEPFLLGSFEQIATRSGERGNADEILMGVGQHGWGTVSGTFISAKGQPGLKVWRFEAPGYSVAARYGVGEKLVSMRVEAPSGTEDVHPKPKNFFSIWSNPVAVLVDVLTQSSWKNVSFEDIRFLYGNIAGNNWGRPYAFSPIRSRPLRTYDPIKESLDPEGGHIPMVLASLHAGDREKWRELQQPISAFGELSGLFDKIDIRRLGKSEAEPFQIQVVMNGSPINLVDVGYGVSQVLPILVDCLRGESGRMFLLQQPEVHLNPRVQAELASFLAALAKKEEKQFLIETHSDYLIDRLRLDVRDRKHDLKPEDVAILFFERGPKGVTIYPMGIDKWGNIEGAPKGYRKFILEEERRILGL